MKKYFVSILLIFAIFHGLWAQNDYKKFQVELATGASVYGTALRMGLKNVDITSSLTPAFIGSFYVNLSPAASFGLSLGEQHSAVSGYSDTLGSYKVGLNRLNLSVSGRYNYVNRNGWAVYSGLKFGLSFWTLSASFSTEELQQFVENELGIPMLSDYLNDMISKLTPNSGSWTTSMTSMQVTLLGVSKEIKYIGVFGELALGAPYYFSAGLNYKFNLKK